MTIVSGSLTLPNQLTVQGWLAQFFSTPPDDYGMNTNQLADDGLLSVFTIEAPPGTVFGFSEATVTLTLNGGILSDALAKDRSIAFLSISTPDGKTMLIEFVSPKSASEYFDLLDGGNGAQAFYESIQPNISGFYSQTGSDGDDFMEGFASDDTFVGGLGNDSFRGGGGDDRIDGGDGVDVALWVAEARNFEFKIERLTNAEIEAGNAQMTLTDRRADGDGTDFLTGVELYNFGSGTPETEEQIDGRTFLGLPLLSEADLLNFVELYIAYFNRAPDAIGLNFWGTAYANGTTLEEMATLFIDQDETRATYGEDLNNAGFATAVYGNVLGRVADQLGFDFWVNALDSGAVGRDQFILSVLEGAKAPAPPDATPEFVAQQQADQVFLSHKTDLGAYFSVTKGMSDVENARAAMELFDGSQASLTDAVNAIDSFFQDASSPTDGEFIVQHVGIFDDPFAQ